MELKKIDFIAKKITAAIVAPFIGKGKLKQYKEKSDGWMMNQMDTGKVDPGIPVNKDNDNQIRFKSTGEDREKLIAKKITRSLI